MAKLPLGQRYLLSKTLKADLISTLIEDPELRGAVESYEAIIEKLEAQLEQARLGEAAHKADKLILEDENRQLKRVR